MAQPVIRVAGKLNMQMFAISGSQSRGCCALKRGDGFVSRALTGAGICSIAKSSQCRFTVTRGWECCQSVVGHEEPPLLPGCAARDALELLRLCWETRPGQQQGRKGCSAVKEMLEKQEGARAESTALQPCGRGGGERVGPGRGRGAGRAQGGGATPEISTAPVRAGRRHFACFFSF